jgi:hypothetical protein
VYCGLVLIPYGLLALAVYLATDRKSYLWINGVTGPAIGLALFLYSWSFGPNDGEYAGVYIFTPILQSPFVLIALGVSLWRRYQNFRPVRNDPRIKRLLKRYRKGDNLVDATIDVSSIDLGKVLRALRFNSERDLASPKELDDQALSFFSRALGSDFKREHFDYFLHSYVRAEFVSSYYKDPAITSKPAPEGGPPAPSPEGTEWVPVRPQEGREHFEAFDIAELRAERPTVH